MSTFLWVVLGIVLGVVLTPVLLWIAFKLFVYFFLKRLIKQFARQGGAPPMRIEVDPLDEEEWNNGPVIERLTAELEKHGFVQAGDYTIQSSPAVDGRGFANADRGLYALIYDWPEGLMEGLSVMVDVVAREAADGEATPRGFTVSNAPETGLDQPSWSSKRSLDIDIENAGLAIPTLLERMAELTDQTPLDPVAPERFVPALKSAYAREMDWQIERGGLQREEIIRNAVMTHGLAEDGEKLDELVETTQTQWRYAIDEFVSEETRKRFIRHVAKMSVGEWEDSRDRIVVVHERSMPEALAEELTDTLLDQNSFDDEDEDDAYQRRYDEASDKAKAFFEGRGPRAAFEAAQELMPAERRYKRLARIKSPWPADVYVRPESDEAT